MKGVHKGRNCERGRSKKPFFEELGARMGNGGALNSRKNLRRNRFPIYLKNPGRYWADDYDHCSGFDCPQMDEQKLLHSLRQPSVRVEMKCA